MFKDELARRWSLRWGLALVAFLLPSAWAMPTNTILFIGDGMGYGHVAAAGYYANGTSGTLSFESFPYQGQVTTYSASAAITDSAAAATAMATGRKVNNGVISTALPGDGSELKTILEYAAHNNDIERTIDEVLEFSRAVQTAVDWAVTVSALDTLILVTAGHETGGLAFAGNNGAGLYPDVTWTTTGHTAANVPIYGWGPGSDQITPVMDNTQIYALMTTERCATIPAPRATSLALVGVGLLVLRTRRQREA